MNESGAMTIQWSKVVLANLSERNRNIKMLPIIRIPQNRSASFLFLYILGEINN
jgi:hypothetical protein